MPGLSLPYVSESCVCHRKSLTAAQARQQMQGLPSCKCWRNWTSVNSRLTRWLGRQQLLAKDILTPWSCYPDAVSFPYYYFSAGMKACVGLTAASVAPSLIIWVQPSARAIAYVGQMPCNKMPSPLAILSFLFLKLSFTTLSSDTNGQHGGCCRSAQRDTSQMSGCWLRVQLWESARSRCY